MRTGLTAFGFTTLDCILDTLRRISDVISALGEKSWETFSIIFFADLLATELISGSLDDEDFDFFSDGAAAGEEVSCVNVNPSDTVTTFVSFFVLAGNEVGNFALPENLDEPATAETGVKSFATRLLGLELIFDLVENEAGNDATLEEAAPVTTFGLKSFLELFSFSVAKIEVTFVSVGSADLNWLSRDGRVRVGELYEFVDATIVGTPSSDVGTEDFAGNGVTAANVIGSLSFFENEESELLKLGTFQSAERYFVSLRNDLENGLSRPVRSFVF